MIGEIDLLRRLLERIEKEITDQSDGIVSGKLESFERYRFATGFVQGLQWVLDCARDIADTSKPPTEETEQQRGMD